LEAGIDIDVSMLKLIGSRGFMIAIIGSVLPIGLGIVIALALGSEPLEAIAAGATFGPTSLGIALNILRSGGILNTPVGQLIIAAAVIDDMIALIILSQLESLSGTIDAAAILIPIISACGFLIAGGYAALFLLPPVMQKLVLSRINPEYHAKVEMAVMFLLVLVMMPATFYAKASYLMGAFVSGLAFCTSHDLHSRFVNQLKRVMQWLMRIFFAASIGFQVPVKDFGSGVVIWQGLVFSLALMGKLGVGFLVPNFTQSPRFTGSHLRDCLITGFSMAAEGEFAFVIAVFSVDSGLINKDLYASVVLAVLLSTIIPPFLLKFTINYYNRKAQEAIEKIVKEELDNNYDLEPHTADEERAEKLVEQIRSKRAIFLCIQTQSEIGWGLLPSIMASLTKLGIDIIDHRSWHPRGIATTLVNEIYCEDKIDIKQKGQGQVELETRIAEIEEALAKVIAQPETSNVKVSRWYPGVVEEITESVVEKHKVTGKSCLSVENRLLKEASERLTKRQTMQTSATVDKSVEEILNEMHTPATVELGAVKEGQAGVEPIGLPTTTAKPATKSASRRHHRQKMRSTPVVGGGLFGETSQEEKESDREDMEIIKEGLRGDSGGAKIKKWKPSFNLPTSGTQAEIIVDGESYTVRINNDTLKALRTGFSGDTLDSRGIFSSGGISIQPDSTNVVSMLGGYVRTTNGALGLGAIMEEGGEVAESETSSTNGGSSTPNV
jgi:Kef-type K+ transport system membrane component KefB